MIVLDEQLQGAGLEQAIARWYRGRVCFIAALRPGSVVKDDGAGVQASVTPKDSVRIQE